MNNIPEVKLGIVAVSRDCFPIGLSIQRRAAIKAAYDEGQSKLRGNGRSVPPLTAIKTPLRDGDIERPDDEAYRNAYFINANSATAPGVVDADRQPITAARSTRPSSRS